MTYLECSCGKILHARWINRSWKDHSEKNPGHFVIRRYSNIMVKEAGI